MRLCFVLFCFVLFCFVLFSVCFETIAIVDPIKVIVPENVFEKISPSIASHRTKYPRDLSKLLIQNNSFWLLYRSLIQSLYVIDFSKATSSFSYSVNRQICEKNVIFVHISSDRQNVVSHTAQYDSNRRVVFCPYISWQTYVGTLLKRI